MGAKQALNDYGVWGFAIFLAGMCFAILLPVNKFGWEYKTSAEGALYRQHRGLGGGVV